MNKSNGVFELLGVIIGFLLSFWNLWLGIVLVFMILMLCVIGLKNKKPLLIIAFALSICAFLFLGFRAFIELETSDKSSKQTSDTVHSLYEERLKLLAEDYINKNNIGNDYVVKSSEVNYTYDCVGYAVYKKSDNSIKSYIKCSDNYITDGYNDQMK